MLRIGLFLCLLIIPIETFHKRPVIDIRQEQCLATVLYHEARGESAKGRAAVAAVALNRAARANYDVCAIMSKPAQFSWYKHKPTLLPISTLGTLLWDAHVMLEQHRGGLRTLDASHFAHKSVRNYWTTKFHKVATIGKLAFYREKK